ncbi:MAG: nucleoside phosphorylase [Salinimicrobium sp.]
MNNLAASELILNKDGSIYHLNLRPEHLADTVIVVGDPDRVQKISKHFDNIEFKIQKREFHTHTGTYKGKRISVISTGIGTDNIDIVINELDALVNIDFETRKIKSTTKQLDIIRVGTSGSIQKEIPVDAFVVSKRAVGFDALMHFYQSESVQLEDFNQALDEQLQLSPRKSKAYAVACDEDLAQIFEGSETVDGFTGSNIGFYGPQGRVLRLPLKDTRFMDKLEAFDFKGVKITNLEMETSAIYGMSKMLGHRAVSLNAVVANRPAGEFSKDAGQTVENLIKFTLDRLAGK